MVRESKESITLKEYFCTKLGDLKALICAELDTIRALRQSDKEALETAKSAMEERLNKMNEFRDAIKDQNANFVTKPEFEARIDSVCKDIVEFKEFIAAINAKADQKQVDRLTIVSIISIVIALVSVIINHL